MQERWFLADCLICSKNGGVINVTPQIGENMKKVRNTHRVYHTGMLPWLVVASILLMNAMYVSAVITMVCYFIWITYLGFFRRR